MVIIEGTPTFINKGAIVPSDVELETIIDALKEKADCAWRAKGDYHGKMTLEELNVLLAELEEYKAKRGS